MFKKHIMTAHNMAPEEYQNNFGDPALVKQLHICKVSEKELEEEEMECIKSKMFKSGLLR